MSAEQESSEEILKRSTLLSALSKMPSVESETTAMQWVDEMSQSLRSINETLKREVGENWILDSFYPAYTAVEASHAIVNEDNIEISPMLYLTLFGIGYEIGSNESILETGLGIGMLLRRAGVLNYRYGFDDEQVLPQVYKSIIAIMLAGSSFKERKIAVFEEYLGKLLGNYGSDL